MAGDLLLRCVPDVSGSGASPCPTGYVPSVIEVNLPLLLGSDWGEVAAFSAGAVVLLFATGLGAGWVIRMMEGSH